MKCPRFRVQKSKCLRRESLLQGRGEGPKTRPVREETSPERAKEIMASTPVLTEKALAEKRRLAEKKSRRRQ